MNIESLKNVPSNPGVYIWKDKNEKIIYIGKANNLKQRMSQYFKGMLNSYKTSTLVKKINSFDYIITSSPREALLLERNLIMKNSPEFNILLTDDKRYPYIAISLKDKLEIKLVYRVREKKGRNIKYFGPFPNGFGARSIANLLERKFLFKEGLPDMSANKEYWEQKFKDAKEMLVKGVPSLIREQHSLMLNFSENEEYVLANEAKNNWEALLKLREDQAVELNSDENVDVIGFTVMDQFMYINMFFYRNGLLLSKKEFNVPISISKNDSLRQFISQYYSFNKRPDEIIMSEDIESDYNILVPSKGKKKQMLEIATKNSSDNIELKQLEIQRKEEQTLGAVQKLAGLLGESSISSIAMIDNSNTANFNPVSVVVVYINGIKRPEYYRKFNVERRDRLADVDYIQQGFTKYFSSGQNLVPDLFILDGGIQQMNEILKLNPEINLIGLVKDENHRTKHILTQYGEVIAIKDRFLWNFLAGVQNEVDRYAKVFHRKKMNSSSLSGKLTSIKGIGSKMEQKLLDHFKTYSNVYAAPLEELMKVTSKAIALKIKDKNND